MTNELATIPSRPARQQINKMSDVVDIVQHLGELWDLAKILVDSQLIPKSVKSVPAAVAIMLKGRELGLGPMASFDLLTVIQGKAGVSPQGMLALINNSGLCDGYKIWDDGQAAFCTMKRKGGEPHTERFGMDDAEKFMTSEWEDGKKRDIKLSEKLNWKSQPRTMRKWRVVAACSRVVFPDVVAGLYTAEELGGAITEDGEILEAEVVPAQKFPDQGSGHGRTGSYAHDDHDAAFRKMLIESNGTLVSAWKAAWTAEDAPFPQGLLEQPVRSYEVIMHLYNEDVAAGRLQGVATTVDENTGEVVPKASIEQLRKMVAITFAKDPKGVRDRVERYMHRQAMNVAVGFVNAHRGEMIPMEFDPEYNQDDGDAPEDRSQEEPEPLPPPEPAKKLGKKELAEKLKARLEAEARERARLESGIGEAAEDEMAEAVAS